MSDQVRAEAKLAVIASASFFPGIGPIKDREAQAIGDAVIAAVLSAGVPLAPPLPIREPLVILPGFRGRVRMQTLAWILVLLLAGFGLLLLMASLIAPAIQQAAVGTMVTGFVVCAIGIALAVQGLSRK